MNNDQKIIDLLKSRAVVQRRLRSVLEDLEAVTNEIEVECARIDGREPLRKRVDVCVRDVSAVQRAE